MNLARAKLLMAQAARNYGLEPGVYPPSQYLETLGGWEVAWQDHVTQVKAGMQMGIWQGGPLPNGLPAPEGAVAGAAYYILLPDGGLIFQYGDSPYSPDTPGAAPGPLTPENVEAAMEAHADRIASEKALARLIEGYLEWVANQL